jgi:hypothetical protein
MTVRVLRPVALAPVCGDSVAQFDHGHAAWAALLKKHAVALDAGRASRVRYAVFQQDRSELNAYLAALGKASRAYFGGCTNSQQLA